MERFGEKMEISLYPNVKEEGCAVGQYSDDSVCVGVYMIMYMILYHVSMTSFTQTPMLQFSALF